MTRNNCSLFSSREHFLVWVWWFTTGSKPSNQCLFTGSRGGLIATGGCHPTWVYWGSSMSDHYSSEPTWLESGLKETRVQPWPHQRVLIWFRLFLGDWVYVQDFALSWVDCSVGCALSPWFFLCLSMGGGSYTVNGGYFDQKRWAV